MSGLLIGVAATVIVLVVFRVAFTGTLEPLTSTRAPGACLPGKRHDGVPVELSTGEVVAHVCVHCYVRLAALDTPSGYTTWLPHDDNGRPLPMFPNPGIVSRR